MPPGAWTLWMLPLTPLGSAGGGQGATRCLDPVLRAVPTTRQVSGWTENPLAPVRLSARGVPAKGNTAPVLESLHSSEEMVSIHTLDTEHGVGRFACVPVSVNSCVFTSPLLAHYPSKEI